jgi:hypothetical protein
MPEAGGACMRASALQWLEIPVESVFHDRVYEVKRLVLPLEDLRTDQLEMRLGERLGGELGELGGVPRLGSVVQHRHGVRQLSGMSRKPCQPEQHHP